MNTDEDGMMVIRGRLPKEVAAFLQKALDAAMDSLMEEGVDDDSAESRQGEDFTQRRVDALGLLVEAALGKGLCQTERGEP